MNMDPFSKNGLNTAPGKAKSSTDEIFVKSKNGGVGGGSSLKRKAEADAHAQAEAESEAHFKSRDKVEEPEEKPKPVVTLHSPKWSVSKGHFNEKAGASVEGDLPPESANLTRVEFILYAFAPDGKKERIEAKDGYLKDKKAEVEFTLFRPAGSGSGGIPQSVPYGFTAKHRDSKIVESPRLDVSPILCNDIPPPVTPTELGACHYYTWRIDNFVSRHKGCARKPPEYYLNYGFKYCVRFGTVTAPKLSAIGKVWLQKARLFLQQRMEKEIKLNPDLELDSPKFTQMAFDTHAGAYWDAGLGTLPLTDLVIIGYTPDIKEWMDSGTRAQAYDISGRLVTEWGKNLQDAAKKQADEITDYFKKIF